MDIMENYHLFAKEVAVALEKAGVRPLSGDTHAVMVIITPAEGPEGGRNPMGGALNWEEKKGIWELQTEMLPILPMSSEDEE